MLDGDERATSTATTSRRALADVDGTPVRMLTIGDEVHRVVVRPGATRGRYTLWLDGYRLRGRGARRADARDSRAGRRATAGADGPGAARRADAGADRARQRRRSATSVQPGQGLVVMEAMKMENELRATAAGDGEARARRTPGTAVEKGALLLELE